MALAHQMACCGDFNGALQVYSAVLNAHERNPQTPKLVSQVLANRSWCRRLVGDLKGACQDATTAVALQPFNPRMHVMRSKALLMSLELVEADKCLRRAEQLLPGHYEISRLIVITLLCRYLVDGRKSGESESESESNALFVPRQGGWDQNAKAVLDAAFQRYFPEYNKAVLNPPSNGCRLTGMETFGMKLYSKNPWLQSESVARRLEQVRYLPSPPPLLEYPVRIPRSGALWNLPSSHPPLYIRFQAC